MSVNIITQFKTKPGRAEDLIALIRKLLPQSLEQPGCEEVALRQNQDEPGDVIFAQRWTSRRHYENYMTGRAASGLTGQFDELLAGEAQVRYFNDIPISNVQVREQPALAPAQTLGARKPPIPQREIPKISTSDAPGG